MSWQGRIICKKVHEVGIANNCYRGFIQQMHFYTLPKVISRGNFPTRHSLFLYWATDHQTDWSVRVKIALRLRVIQYTIFQPYYHTSVVHARCSVRFSFWTIKFQPEHLFLYNLTPLARVDCGCAIVVVAVLVVRKSFWAMQAAIFQYLFRKALSIGHVCMIKKVTRTYLEVGWQHASQQLVYLAKWQTHYVSGRDIFVGGWALWMISKE